MEHLRDIEILITIDTNKTTNYEVVKLAPGEEVSDAIVNFVKKIKTLFPHEYKTAVMKLKNKKVEQTPDTFEQQIYKESKEQMRNWLT